MLRDATLKFTRELSATLTVQRVSADGIFVAGECYARAIALTPDTLYDRWEPKPVAELDSGDFAALLDADPELVLLGTGQRNIFPPRDLVFAFARRRVGLEVMDTAAAARTFNVLATEGRRVAAVLYPRNRSVEQ